MQPEKNYRRPRDSWPQSKRNWLLPRERYPVCRGLSNLLLIVLMLTTALCYVSCGTTKKSQTEQTLTSSTSERTDTTAAMARLIRTQTVPESKVRLTVSVDSLLKLPAGAAYRESNGRAHVEATQKEGIIYIIGTCDSLQRQVEYYEALYHTARDALEQYERSLKREQHKTRETSIWPEIGLLIFGFIAGALSTIYITKEKLFKNG